jgi:hypothetical protein
LQWPHHGASTMATTISLNMHNCTDCYFKCFCTVSRAIRPLIVCNSLWQSSLGWLSW